jgi:transposase
MQFRDTITTLIANTFGTQKALAKHFGVSTSTVRRWAKREDAPHSKAAKSVNRSYSQRKRVYEKENKPAVVQKRELQTRYVFERLEDATREQIAERAKYVSELIDEMEKQGKIFYAKIYVPVSKEYPKGVKYLGFFDNAELLGREIDGDFASVASITSIPEGEKGESENE